MPIYDLTCESGHIQRDLLLSLGERPPCPTCGEPTHTHWEQSSGVIGDDIPGGIEIRHGLVHPDGSPMKFYSKSAILKEAAKRGLIQNPNGKPDAKPRKRAVHFDMGGH